MFDSPESVSDFPESVSDFPESKSDFPESKSDFPESVSDFPESSFDFPESDFDSPKYLQKKEGFCGVSDDLTLLSGTMARHQHECSDSTRYQVL
ncbi:MAG: hypothetical protein LBJ41_10025 [Treponema sp.]|jgi:hypothetical protein|nr:hypothetical protein [Treponema sp.]